MSAPTPKPSGSAAAADTVIPKSYAKDVATTPDPWQLCAKLEFGGDRSYAWSVQQEIVRCAPSGRAKLETRLLNVLAQPECSEAGRAFVCEMLALIGSAASVPALAALLRQPRAIESARFALEAIPAVEAVNALREALNVVQRNAKAGLIGSLAARRDAAARPALAALKDNATEPSVVRDAATRALAVLGTS